MTDSASVVGEMSLRPSINAVYNKSTLIGNTICLIYKEWGGNFRPEVIGKLDFTNKNNLIDIEVFVYQSKSAPSGYRVWI